MATFDNLFIKPSFRPDNLHLSVVIICLRI